MPARLLPTLILAAFCISACANAPETPAPQPLAADTVTAVAPVFPDPSLANGAAAGVYRLDKSHASLVFAADHLGFSNYVGQFTRFDATLTIDPAAPETATLTATIDPTSLTIPAPPEGFLDALLGPDWFNSAAFPEITFVSTAIRQTSPAEADVTGNLTFLGATLPVTFSARFNGAYPGFPPYDPNARAGFHASGSLSRSAFGMTYGLPPEGSTMGVGDEVKFWIDAEFTGPPAEETT
ncbi:MAG: polyisoprenoid-binding protein [Alphaproteobacteria bacterium HGW-Alphaproteobacteria-18]|nr:MAG: polyisoprenoid-binding protein [Alphaproteobacteria bacterium HGW-Alphaproteobacteria-18]